VSDLPAPKPAFPSVSEMLGVSWRFLGLGLLALVLAVLAGWQGWRYYRSWQIERLCAQAEKHYAENRWREATIAAREVLRLVPDNVAAARLMTRISDRVYPQAALGWHRRMAQLEPDNPEHLFNLALTAMKVGELAAAEDALAKLAPAWRQTARYQEMAGTLALACRQVTLAEECFRQAARLDTNLWSARFNLASLNLHLAHPNAVAQGRREMEALLALPSFRLLALKALVAEARKTSAEERLERYLPQLAAEPGATVEERLLWIEWLRQRRPNDYPAELKKVMQQARSEPGQAALLATWLTTSGQAAAALDFLQSLDPATRKNQPIVAAMADCLGALKRWDDLLALTGEDRGAEWFGLEFLQHLHRTRALRAKEETGPANRMWRRTEAEAGDEPYKLALLARTAYRWGWLTDAEYLWWKQARSSGGRLAALGELFRLYYAQGRGRDLLKVAEAMHALNPSEPFIVNNFAFLSLLLGRDLTNAAALARENFRRAPESDHFGLTLAFAESRLGNHEQALELAARIKRPEQMGAGDLACYGLILHAAGQSAAARPFLQKSLITPGLLQEEREAVMAALRP